MSKIELLAKIELLNKYEAMIDELKEKADSIRDELKSHMLALDTEELFAGTYVLRYTPVVSNRFDTAAFKRMHGDIYKAYTKQVSSRRFTIN